MLPIEAPAAQPDKGGLFAHITPSTNVQAFAFEYGVTFTSVLAGAPQPVPEGDTDKEFGSVDHQKFYPFTVYSGIEAQIVDDKAGALKALEDAFEGNLSKAAETAIQRSLLNPKATVLHDTPITNARTALGMLEQWASEELGVQPMIHTNKLGASMLRDLKDDGGALRTKQFTPVANGGGYTANGPGDQEAGVGEAWVYVSRIPTLYRTETKTVEAHGLKQNRFYALSEARFVPIIEGDVAAVLLKGEL